MKTEYGVSGMCRKQQMTEILILKGALFNGKIKMRFAYYFLAAGILLHFNIATVVLHQGL